MSDANTADEMACRELVQVITAYLDGGLTPEDRGRFDAHLEECPYCVTYLEQMRETIRSLGELTVDSIPAETRREIVAAFGGWHNPR